MPQDKTSLYTGYIDKNGKRRGFGLKIFKNGDRYEGEWENNRINGYVKTIAYHYT